MKKPQNNIILSLILLYSLLSLHLTDSRVISIFSPLRLSVSSPCICLSIRHSIHSFCLSGFLAQGPIEVRSLSQGSNGVRILSYRSLLPVIPTAFSIAPPLIWKKSHISHYLRDNGITTLDFPLLHSLQLLRLLEQNARG